jgi:hypothetical protein
MKSMVATFDDAKWFKHSSNNDSICLSFGISSFGECFGLNDFVKLKIGKSQNQ